MRSMRINGWMRSMKEGMYPAHFFVNGKSSCRKRIDKSYIDIDEEHFPEKKYCPECREKK